MWEYEEIASKGRIRQVIESEHVENAVSYLSGYAPALVNFYGSVKEQLPETLKTHVDTLENDYVVPTAKKSFDVANTIVDQVDSHLGKAEETVISNLESTRATVETTKEIVYTNVESTKQVVLSNVESTKQVVLCTEYEHLDDLWFLLQHNYVKALKQYPAFRGWFSGPKVATQL